MLKHKEACLQVFCMACSLYSPVVVVSQDFAIMFIDLGFHTWETPITHFYCLSVNN